VVAEFLHFFLIPAAIVAGLAVQVWRIEKKQVAWMIVKTQAASVVEVLDDDSVKARAECDDALDDGLNADEGAGLWRSGNCEAGSGPCEAGFVGVEEARCALDIGQGISTQQRDAGRRRISRISSSGW
jgi:hypothetical protein